MANYIANAGSFVVYTTETGTTPDWTATAYVNDGAIEDKTGVSETTTYGSTAKTFIAGLNEATMKFKVLADDTTYASSPQGKLDAIRRLKRNMKLMTTAGTTNGLSAVFQGIITDVSWKMGNDGERVSADVSVQVSGVITYAAG